ncbi:MAG: hypothetical protein RL033_91 [Pseudomonadota bacterium]|jgi:hypothetical protein
MPFASAAQRGVRTHALRAPSGGGSKQGAAVTAAGRFTGWSLSPVLASAAMSLSSVSVLVNSLRLRRFEGSETEASATPTNGALVGLRAAGAR